MNYCQCENHPRYYNLMMRPDDLGLPAHSETNFNPLDESSRSKSVQDQVTYSKNTN